ncbi:MAG: alpha/beta fold hydrolase [Planctomycetes bacterium]|nr:alpha/beta fold hydrolase [Planctomycetota bacterium]
MDVPLLPCVTIEPREPARHAILWLHGLGADGHDFEPIVPELRLPDELAIRFVFPHAPHVPVTINGGMRMPAWYDIAFEDLSVRHDEEGILRSHVQLEALIQREVERGIRTDHIILAGFSQGGAIALHTGLRHGERLAGILALSTYLIREDSLEDERSPANLETPIFQAHGTHDTMVVLPRGEHARDRLRELGHVVTFSAYPMAHEVCRTEIDDVGRWIERVFGAA